MIDKKNGEHYPDPTAYAALKSISDREKRVSALVKCLKQIAVLSGYDVVNRIELRELDTGRVYR